MVSAVSGGTTTAIPAAGAAPRRSPSLDAQLNTCRAQLEDWVTCPSAKTPEGKAKIEQITAKYDSIKKQIVKANDATAPPAERAKRSATALVANAEPSRRDAGSTLGRTLDVYA